jgi:hypothetical protein
VQVFIEGLAATTIKPVVGFFSHPMFGLGETSSLAAQH